MKKVQKVFVFLLPVLLILAAVSAYLLYFTANGLPAIMEGTSGYGSFDLRFSYSSDALLTIISHFKGDRLAAYTNYFTYDFIFAGLRTLFLVFFPLTFNTLSNKHYLWFRACMFSAVFSCVFDVLENVILLDIVRTFPGFTGAQASLASGCTTIKWVFFGLWILTGIVFMILTLITYHKISKNTARQVVRT